jgi:hypothetical protein
MTLAAIGALGVAAGKVKEGQIAAAQGDFEKEIAIRNQQSLERQATAERAASKIEEGRVARKSRLVQARLEAGQAKSGLGLAGATVDALADAAFQFSFDRNLVLRQGLIRSRELQQKGKIIAAGGRFAKTLGRQKRTALFMSAAGSAFGAASSLSNTNPPPRTSPSGPSSVGDLNTGTTTSSGRVFV